MSTKIVKIELSGNKLFSFGPMHILRDRRELEAYRANRESIGFVPTMGALHDGHLSLVRASKQENACTIVSIFVNPRQFNNPEDLEKYPRDLDADIHLLEKARVDAVFVPTAEVMYPPGEDVSTYEHDFAALETVMEGAYRPGHFKGMAMVVHKFLEMVKPDKAYFGRKDFQQLLIIRNLVKKTGLPVEIRSLPIRREENGLAMSSRNQRLGEKDREKAGALFQSLQWMQGNFYEMPVAELKNTARARLESRFPEIEIEYLEIADANTLRPTNSKENAMAFIAAYVAGIRLIDNIELNGRTNQP